MIFLKIDIFEFYVLGYLFHIERTFPNKLFVTEISYVRVTKC